MDINKLTDKVFFDTNKIINEHGTRLAGSKGSIDTAEHLFNEAKSFSDSTSKDHFFVHKGAFLGWIKILVFNYFISVILIWFNLYLYSAILSLISIVILVLQFFLYLPLIDKLIPKKDCYNVSGTIEPDKEVKQQIIISGHHDSAHIFNFFVKQPKLYNLRTTGSIAVVILMLVLSIVSIFIKIDLMYLIINIVLSLGFLLIAQMWFFTSKKGTLGAGDNLIATTIAFNIGSYFYNLKQQNKGLENTRIIFASFDAEEEGLRGARAFVNKNKKALLETKTYVLNADCLYDENEFFFLTSDLNNFVKLDESLVDELINTSKDLNINVKKQPLAFLTGGTDAAEFAKANISATTLIGMPWSNENRSPYYHTLNDTLDNVSRKVVSQSLELFITYIKNKDNNM